MWIVVGCALIVPSARGQDTALLIGNSNYLRSNNLPGDFYDLVRKHNSLGHAGWVVVNMEDLKKDEMITAIRTNAPQSGKHYFVWFSGHGDTSASGALVGVDENNVTPADFVSALQAAGVADRTTVKLDSCGSGAFKDAANLIAGGDAATNGLAFITSTLGTETCFGGSTGSVFTTCFVAGLKGLADGADGSTPNGSITVAEAGAYAKNKCSGAYDNNDNGDWVIGRTGKEGITCCFPNGSCIAGISEEVCSEKNGVPLPAVSEWGMLVLVLLLMTGITIRFRQGSPAQ